MENDIAANVNTCETREDLLLRLEAAEHDIARHVEIASREGAARVEAEQRLATIRAETIEECATKAWRAILDRGLSSMAACFAADAIRAEIERMKGGRG